MKFSWGRKRVEKHRAQSKDHIRLQRYFEKNREVAGNDGLDCKKKRSAKEPVEQDETTAMLTSDLINTLLPTLIHLIPHKCKRYPSRFTLPHKQLRCIFPQLCFQLKPPKTIFLYESSRNEGQNRHIKKIGTSELMCMRFTTHCVSKYTSPPLGTSWSSDTPQIVAEYTMVIRHTQETHAHTNSCNVGWTTRKAHHLVGSNYLAQQMHLGSTTDQLSTNHFGSTNGCLAELDDSETHGMHGMLVICGVPYKPTRKNTEATASELTALKVS